MESGISRNNIPPFHSAFLGWNTPFYTTFKCWKLYPEWNGKKLMFNDKDSSFNNCQHVIFEMVFIFKYAFLSSCVN